MPCKAKYLRLFNCIIRFSLALYFAIAPQTTYAQRDTLVFYPLNNQVLQQYDIRKIAIAKDGKLWLSADKGVIRYDGNDIRFFGRGEGGNMVMDNKSISRSYFDSEGNLYCVIVWGKIYYLNTKTGKVDYLDIQITEEDSSNFDKIYPYTEIFLDNNEFMWAGRTNMGFIGYNLRTKNTNAYHLPFVKNGYLNTVNTIQKDLKNDSILWLGTNNGIYSFNKKTQELKRNFHCSKLSDSSKFDIEVLKIQMKGENTIWFTAAKKGIGCYNIKKGIYTMYPLKKEFSPDKTETEDLIFFQYKSDSEYYIGSQKSCPGTFNTRTHQYAFKTKTYQPYPALNINHVVADSSGNLWCIIFGQLYFASAQKKKFTSLLLQDINNKDELTNVFKTVIWDDKRKYYYAAFDNSNAISVLDSNIHLVKSIPLISPENKTEEARETNIYDVQLDQRGRLWACGTFLFVYDSAFNKMVTADRLYSQLKFPNQYFQNMVVRNEHLYLQPSNSDFKAIYRINTKNFTWDSIAIPTEIALGKTVTFQSEKSLDVLVIDKQEQYAYVGIHNTVLQLDLKNKTARHVATVAIKEFEHFFNMSWYLLDDNNHLWISSSNGINVYDPYKLQIIKRIAHPEGSYRLQFFNADSTGVMCVLYSQGILLYDYKNNKQHHLSVSDGLITFFNSGISCVHNTLFAGAKMNTLFYLPLSAATKTDADRTCYLSDIRLFNQPYFTDTLPEYLHSLTLPHDKNFITFAFSSTEFEQPERLEYRYKLTGATEDWIVTNFSNRTITYNNLLPGSYDLYLSVKQPDGKWHNSKTALHITIIPAWWQTTWFKILCVITACVLAFTLIRWRINTVRKQEQEKAKTEKELLELEAKALRAQMNPHFIFNCMNSIKSLIQQDDKDKAASYLTTFSKLIRTIFQNSDKREITLHDEIETCRLYTQLESMRFGNKLSYSFDIDETIDLKSIMVPALILQPFIENAIWHGLIPKEEGGALHISVSKKDDKIHCIVEDDGIGRELSMRNKFNGSPSTHQSKGVRLTQSRLELNNTLNRRDATVEIIDKTNGKDEPTGTKVILVFNEY